MAKLAYERKNGFFVLAIFFVVAVVSIYILMGHPSFGGSSLTQVDDATALKELAATIAKHGVENGFIPISVKMEGYINDLSILRGRTGNGSASAIIDAELSSANSHYYLTRALEELNLIDRAKPNCGGAEIKEIILFCDSSIREANAAVAKINSLNGEDKEKIRENGLEIAQSNIELAEEVKAQVNKIC
ncbi:MAG: hypothetical protein NTZ73_02270 [Candidatus Diapherotrites archaeon]|nr:hypothetical protein [Candidatus Diapherotrites archaeon]